MKRALAITCLLLLGACSSPGGTGPEPLPSATAGAGSGGAPTQVPNPVPAEVPNPLGRYRCHAPPGMGSPSTIEQAIALLNALPKPTHAACFVESLDRPLAIFATSSVFSAQPAFSAASPRVFIKIGQLYLSVVIDGEGRELLEFGHVLPPDPAYPPRSIKGEVHFPVVEPLGPSAPYDRVIYQGNGTLCRVCHFGEEPANVPGVTNAFSSVAFQPRSDTYVSTEALRVAASICDWQVEPNRCEMLSALFDYGEVFEAPFPADMPRFF